MAGRVLFLPSHVGLGHVARDVVIARLLSGATGASVEWCTAEPARGFLEALGERLAPGCPELESFSRAIEDIYNGRVRGLRDLAGLLSILRRNRERLDGLIEGYDLVFADEFWEIVYSTPDAERSGAVLATDIVYKPYTPRPLDLLVSLALNRYFKRVLPRYRALIYLNDPSLLGGARWYPLLGGSVRAWLERHAHIAGLATSYPPGGLPGRGEARRRLGIAGDEALVVVTVGGTSAASVGLLDCIEGAAPELARAVEGELGLRARIIALPGPRTAWRPRGGLVEVPEDPSPPGLLDYYAAADLFISRAGRTTTADLLCAGIPAVLIPIPGHFEQEEIARHMEEAHGYPRLDQRRCRPEALARAARAALKRRPRPPGSLCQGGPRAARLLAALLRGPEDRGGREGGGGQHEG